uniref:RNase III domain-containing protein n=1 Tax=viral metagenome TaxID=1070528 RepID=A0A6C0JIK1_9ZZZZ
MNTDETITLDPWNDNNHLLTEEDVYKIYERVGFENPKKNIKINNLKFYQTAFVHASYVKKCIYESLNKDGNKNVELTDRPNGIIDLFDEHQDYENQEFLGDRVLDFSIAFYIYRKYPDTNQGFKTVLKTKLVKKHQLAKFAKFLDFPKHLIISNQVEEKTEDGRYNIRLLEDSMEAFICAIFLDQNSSKYYSKVAHDLKNVRLIGPGWAVANAFIENLIEKTVDFEEMLSKEENYKEQLLQFYQKEFKLTPEYVCISVRGPPNRRIFTQGVLDKSGNIIGQGVGKKKTEAEQNASLNALQYFGVLDKDGKTIPNKQ